MYIMKKFAAFLAIPFLSMPAFASKYPFGPEPQPEETRRFLNGESMSLNQPYQQAQYIPTQYYPAQMMGGGGSGPVIVPPTVINTQGYEHNSSKKSCKESVVDLFLFSVRRTTGDCTP